MGIRQVLLASYLLSDGGISAKGKNGWTIYFRNKDRIVANHFLKQLAECVDKKPIITERDDGTVFIRLNSSELATELFKISPSYRTKACSNYPPCPHLRKERSSCTIFGTEIIDGIEYPKAKLPEELFKDRYLALKFLRIYSTCDGGVSVVPAKNKKGSQFLVRKVLISVKHPRLSNEIKLLLENLGFSPLQYKDQIRLIRKEDIIKFDKEIGFIDGSKISGDSKFLSGYEKNFILKKVILSYNNPKALLDFLLKIRSSSRLSRD